MLKQERCVSAMFIYKTKLLTFGTRVLHQRNVHEKVSANEKNKNKTGIKTRARTRCEKRELGCEDAKRVADTFPRKLKCQIKT